jgi:maltose O-acetyltransferase
VVANVVAGSYLLPRSLRPALLRRCGIPVGEGTIFHARCMFAGLSVSVGQGCYIGYQCSFESSASITIHDNVFMAHRVNVVTATHELGDHSQRAARQLQLPVTIGRGCWLGTDVSVLPGTTIGDGCVIAAGAVVTADCEPDGMYAGVPARRIRELD